MSDVIQALRKNRTIYITIAILILLFTLAIQGMEPKDWVITMLRGLSVGAVTFLVASGFSLIFGLLDVLNLAHGTLFMIGAYVGWSIYVRPDTFIDVLTPVLLIGAGFALTPLFGKAIGRLRMPRWAARTWPWVGLVTAGLILIWALPKYPITKWDPAVYENSPVTNAYLSGEGLFVVPEPEQFSAISPALGLTSLLIGGLLGAISLAGLSTSRRAGGGGTVMQSRRVPLGSFVAFFALVLAGIIIFIFNTPITNFLFGLSTTWMFFIAVIGATLTGVGLGALMEASLIRPLYARPIYQLMLTLGLSAIGIEIVRAIWGRPEFTMPKPALFNGTGEGCPAESLADLVANQCSTISFLGARIRTYNEIFIPVVGVIVLVGVWLILQRTRIGMIIRAGVQDSDMVEALGINVRQVFTLVFALGVGLAALGGVLAGPSMGLSSVMGESLLLNALIALAIGGLTSYPGAAAGSLLVGLMQQFIIKYGQIGINIPGLAEPFKPTPPLVPASTVLLMVIILLALPQGLFGRKE
jgi:branched-chain amino acid transport system permease protein